MTNEEAIELLKNMCWSITTKMNREVPSSIALLMAIKALEETQTLNGNTLTIKVSEDDIDKVKRVILDCAPWCRVFYQDDKDTNVPIKEIICCKDCKFAHMTVDGECKYCDIWFPDDKTYMPGDYYCASAERKGDSDAVD